ncbi:hypothetical protein LK994_04240 [Ferruginibacter lapsinanis]|uniref:hypothetical protein n=1 Tax=Ferruginibacter lapsinanis TaxID=563172 RepID=UPI001E445665|nr:hypothetical protein [Ferruginibacter lapsinanis]UEG50681.1 hypothetical protein LK994_04240 [Ferruginibacter lapsinanis]
MNYIKKHPMINSIELYKLRNGEYSQFLQDVIEIVNKNNPADLQVQPQLTALIAIAQEIESLFKIPLGSALTQELKNFDLLRDNALKGILAITRGNMYSQESACLSGHFFTCTKFVLKQLN